MKRREFVALACGAATFGSRIARAQQRHRTPVIGVLMAGLESAPENQLRIAAFRQRLAELGWNDGENVHIEYRWSVGQSQLIDQYAKELVALSPDVILANSTPVVTAFKENTTSLPVIFAMTINPVGLGQVKSLAHPGGNLTGFTYIDPELFGKWVDLLKAAAPATTRAAVLFNPTVMSPYGEWVREINAARAGDVEVVAMPVHTDDEMKTAVEALSQRRGSGLMMGPDPFNQVHIAQIAQLANQNGLPAISTYRPFVVEGGLMAYGPNTADIFRRAADYVDRILKGEKPADLPVQQPVTFEFIINVKTAKALGLAVPPNLLALADEVIE